MGLPERSKKALGLKVVRVSDGNYLVQSESDPENWYAVVVHDVQTISCGCPDARYRDVVCKHARAAAIMEERQEVDEL